MSDHLYRRGRVWWAWYYEGDGQVRRSTGCTDKAAARLSLAAWERDAADPTSARRRGATLSDALDLLVNDRRAKAAAGRRSEDTCAFYAKQARNWYLYAGRLAENEARLDAELDDERRTALMELGKTAALVDVDEEFCDGFVAYRRRNSISEHTIAKDRTTLRAALRLSKRVKLWAGDIETVFPRGFESGYEPRDRWLTHREADELLAELEPKRRAVAAFCLATSAEWRGVLRARCEDVSVGLRLVRVRGTKKKTRDREVPILFLWQTKLLSIVRKHADGKDGSLFSKWTNARRALTGACRRANIPHCTFTDLRRTHAHWMKDEGVRQEDLAVSMGHADTKMLDKVYGRATKGGELLSRFEKAAAERRVALTLIPGGRARKGSSGR